MNKIGIYGKVFTEDTVTKEDLKKNSRLVPVFIVNTYVGTADSKLIATAGGIKYSHALLSFNSKLSPMYTFSDVEDIVDDKDSKKVDHFEGFTIDNIKRYQNEFPKGTMRVVVILVTPEIKKAVYDGVQYYVKHEKETKYAFLKLYKWIIGNKKLSSFGDMTMFCSEFVDTMLKQGKIDISGKSSANTSPDDLGTFHDKNNYFQIYEGKITAYDPDKIDKFIDNLKKNTKYKDLQSQKDNSMKDPYDHEIGQKNHLPQFAKNMTKWGVDSVKKKVLGEDGHFYYTEDTDELLE